MRSSSSLTRLERLRLSNILGRLASPFEGERAAAALLASAFVERHGLTWFDVTLGTPSAEPDRTALMRQDRRTGRGRGWRGYCRRRSTQPGGVVSRVA